MRQFYIFTLSSILLFFCFNTGFSQEIQWTGNGDGTSWDDAGNWKDGMVPGTDNKVKIKKDAVITGTMPAAPLEIKIVKEATVSFQLNMKIGNPATTGHGLIVTKNCHVSIGEESGTPYKVDIMTPKHGITNFGGADSASIVIHKNVAINILNSTIGINLSGPHSTFTNDGTITLDNSNKTGLKVVGKFYNNGIINMDDLSGSGITVANNNFVNGEDGIINIGHSLKDCIKIELNGTFQNTGVLNLTLHDSLKMGISIAKDTTVAASFINEGELLIDGGSNDKAKNIYVGDFGDFVNNGETVLSNGDNKGRIFSLGSVVIGKDATLNLGDGRINVKGGTLTNKGLILSTFQGPAIVASDSVNSFATNNAFYVYDSLRNFASGKGTITNSGLGFDASGMTTVDAQQGCSVFLTEEPYEWFLDGVSLGEGQSVTFSDNSLNENSAVLTTTYQGLSVMVTNICDSAVSGCGEVTAPVSGGDKEVCATETIPELTVETVEGTIANWYDAESGGNLLASGTSYTPDVVNPGIYTYYVEAVEEETGCPSDRTPIVLVVHDLPSFTVDSILCDPGSDGGAFIIYFTSNADNITTDMGEVNGNQIDVNASNIDVTVTLTSEEGCFLDYTVEGIDCIGGTEAVEIRDVDFEIRPTLIGGDQEYIQILGHGVKDKFMLLTNTHGKILSKRILNESTIYVGDLALGVYFVTLQSGKWSSTKSFVKM